MNVSPTSRLSFEFLLKTVFFNTSSPPESSHDRLAADTSMKARHCESGRDKLGRDKSGGDKSGREKLGRDEAVVSQKSARSKSIIPTVKSSSL